MTSKYDDLVTATVKVLRETPKVLTTVTSKVSDAVDHLHSYQPAAQEVAA